MRKIAIKMAGLVFYMAAGFVLLFWKLERGGLHNAELLLPLAWLAGAVALGLRLDKACKQAGRWGEAAHHFFSSVIWLLGVVYAVVYAVCGVRAAGEARRNEENGRE